MVEGARLESVYTVTRIEGSNPSLSATWRLWDPCDVKLLTGYRLFLVARADLP